MREYAQVRLAAVQAAPDYFDRDASTEKARRLILEAGAKGVTLAATVIDVGALLSADIVQEACRELAGEKPGESCIIDPTGRVIAGPAVGEQILTADCSEERILMAKSACDVAGHYSRPDIFQLRVNRGAYRRVVELTEPGPAAGDGQGGALHVGEEEDEHAPLR